jgi:hypothetical protein
MVSVCRPTTVADAERLIEFLARVFGTGPEADFVNPALLRWKYWEPRGDYPEPRSFVIEREGRIVAHAGVWPVTVRTGTKSERGIHIIDWAADPQAPGTGGFLLQRLAEKCDFVFAIGGSDITQSYLPKLGFRTIAEAQIWARPLHPWRQILAQQSVNLRLPLRLVRNIWWSKTPPRVIARGWAAIETSAGSEEGLAALAAERDESFFRYIQLCPVAQCRTFQILNKGRAVGFFVLAVAWEQTRVAGVWLEDSSPETWRIAFQLAQDAARKFTNTCEVVARCATEASFDGAGRAGLRLRARMPVFLLRKSGTTDPLPLQFHLSDNDAFFLGGRSAGFVT